LSVETALKLAAEKLEHSAVLTCDPEVEATLRLDIGKTFFDLGAHREAHRHLRRAVDLRRQVLGPRHIDTLAAQAVLAWLLVEGVRTYDEETESICRETWIKRRRVLGPDHPDTLDSLNTYAVALRGGRKLEESERMFRECVKGLERTLG